MWTHDIVSAAEHARPLPLPPPIHSLARPHSHSLARPHSSPAHPTYATPIHNSPTQGGFEGNPPPELLTRWVQWGTFSAMLRTHSSKMSPARSPWLYANPYLGVMRRFYRLRARLLPFLATAQRLSHDSGAQMLRPMYWHFPFQRAAYRDQALHQYFFGGGDVWCAPIANPVVADGSGVLSPGQAPMDPAGARTGKLKGGLTPDLARAPRNGLVEWTVWAPPGPWIEWFSWAAVRGRRAGDPAPAEAGEEEEAEEAAAAAAAQEEAAEWGSGGADAGAGSDAGGASADAGARADAAAREGGWAPGAGAGSYLARNYSIAEMPVFSPPGAIIVQRNLPRGGAVLGLATQQCDDLALWVMPIVAESGLAQTAAAASAAAAAAAAAAATNEAAAATPAPAPAPSVVRSRARIYDDDGLSIDYAAGEGEAFMWTEVGCEWSRRWAPRAGGGESEGEGEGGGAGGGGNEGGSGGGGGGGGDSGAGASGSAADGGGIFGAISRRLFGGGRSAAFSAPGSASGGGGGGGDSGGASESDDDADGPTDEVRCTIGAAEGRGYASFPAARLYTLRFIGSLPPLSVTVDGAAAARDQAALPDDAGEGAAWADGALSWAFHGPSASTWVRAGAPLDTARAHEVRLTFPRGARLDDALLTSGLARATARALACKDEVDRHYGLVFPNDVQPVLRAGASATAASTAADARAARAALAQVAGHVEAALALVRGFAIPAHHHVALLMQAHCVGALADAQAQLSGANARALPPRDARRRTAGAEIAFKTDIARSMGSAPGQVSQYGGEGEPDLGGVEDAEALAAAKAAVTGAAREEL